ncbi:MAG: tol-pal system protein YbgF [Sneathiella sp.]|nr:tol-pal system protein YbgF [Sneathiella sp.]
MILGGATAASAQSSEVQALVNRINRLEQDITDMQRQVYSGAPPAARPSASTSSSLPAAAGNFSNVSKDGLALLLQRINALEAEQRRLTGVQEEASFKINQIGTRLDKLVKDVDFRLTDIERKLGGPGGAPLAAISGSESVTAPIETTPQTSGPVVIGGESLPGGSKVLGTLAAPAGASTAASTGTAAATSPTATASASPTGSVLPAGSASDQYNYAISLVRADRYDEAQVAFTEFMKLHKDDELAGNAQYWLGETYYVRGDFPNAASAFFEGYQNYPNSSKAADNLLKLGMTLGRMDQKQEACATFAQMDKQFDKLPSRLASTAAREKQKLGCAN